MLTFETSAVLGVSGIIEKLGVRVSSSGCLPSSQTISVTTIQRSQAPNFHSRRTTLKRIRWNTSDGDWSLIGMAGFQSLHLVVCLLAVRR